MKTLKDKIVVITGAGSGFGQELANQLVDKSAIPVITDINEDGLNETAAMLDEKGGKYFRYKLDITQKEQWQALADAVLKEYGRVDVLINNAGALSRAEDFLTLSDEHCRFIMDVNFWGMFYGTRTFAPILAKQPEAHLVNLASSLALIGPPMHSIYAASKAAVHNYSDVVREELANTSVNVTVVFPGASKTGLGRNVQFDNEEQKASNIENFYKFAKTTPDVVARAIIKGILKNRPMVVTGADGKTLRLLERLSPRMASRFMGLTYRKTADPKMFEVLNKMSDE